MAINISLEKLVAIVVLVVFGGSFVLQDRIVEAKLRHHMSYMDIEDYTDHPCIRPCEDNAPPKTCDYDFLVEHYHTLTKACYDCPHNPENCSLPHCVAADGALRGLITVNRMLPGPAIHVCEGDTIRVRVHNKMEMSEGTTLHWHGVLQRHSPYMDGVAMVTQCPIPTHTAFTYTFLADTPGTMFWHAHAGMQRSEGLFGHLVIRQSPSNELHNSTYDYDLPEHAVLVNDWLERETGPSFAQHHNSDGDNKPRSMLINGKGVFSQVIHPVTGLNATTPREMFKVKEGFRYRFRMASNGILNCPIRISVDDHMLEIIATDGSPVEPFIVESFDIFAGERYDFVITANQTPGIYLMRAQGLADCGLKFKNAHQTALIYYEGVEPDQSYDVPAPDLNGLRLNPFNTKASETQIQVANLTSLLPDDEALTRQPDKKFVFAMDFNIIDNPRFHNPEYYPIHLVPRKNKRVYTPQMNHISLMFPPAPALSQFRDIPRSMICNNDTVNKNCSDVYCECVHLVKVDLGDVVEVILVDEGHPWDANHPTHLHGNGFRVVAMDKLGTSTYANVVTELDEQGGITRNLHSAPLKDTVTVPDGGYTVIRFHANNPGVWIMHCHIEYHAEIGMGVLFQVGEVHEFPPLPRHFPTCGDWDGDGADDEGFDDTAVFDNDNTGGDGGRNSAQPYLGQPGCSIVLVASLLTLSMCLLRM